MRFSKRHLIAGLLLAHLLGASGALAVDVVLNGTFTTNLNNWTLTETLASGTWTRDAAIGGGSMRFLSATARNRTYQAYAVGNLSQALNANDTVWLSFFWYKHAGPVAASTALTEIYAVPPGGGGDILLWSNASTPDAVTPLQGTQNINVSTLLNDTGTYQLKVATTLTTGNDKNAWVQFNVDNIVLDVTGGAANNAPTVTAGAMSASPSPVNRYGTASTVLAAAFSDADAPGAGAFTVTMKVRQPDNTTEVVLVNALANGAGGLTVSNLGGGNYSASYTWNPGAAQALGLYDLYFAVSDGTDAAIDGYANNLDELTVNEVLPNSPPAVASGAVAASVSPVNRVGTASTTLSALFTDADLPGAGAFTVTLKVRQPDNATEVVLVNALANGAGGLTIADLGGGSYSASYAWDPGAAQALGLYDLYFAVSDGTDAAIDGYANNLDELEVIDAPPNNPPVIAAGAVSASVSPVNRYGSNSTVLSVAFSDADVPGVGAFTVTLKVRAPDNTTELVLVNALTNGAGGLTITNLGGGNYSASYAWNPADAQTLGLYDLYAEVGDGADTAIDGYASNLDELQVNEVIPNFPPVISLGATAVSKSPVGRLSGDLTVISTAFSDANQPGVGAFTVTFTIREPDNATQLVLVDHLGNGAGGLTITDLGGGNYTASYTYDPADTQTLGLYDLSAEVSDGAAIATDIYINNSDELEITDLPPNVAPVIVAGATTASPSSVTRLAGGTTQLSVTFTDSDQPGVGAFTVTFRVREPFGGSIYTVAAGLANGVSGMTIIDGGAGSYTATFGWNPPDNAVLGYYSLASAVSDGDLTAQDPMLNNLDELLVTSVGENNPPVVPADAVFASPAGVERIGPNLTTLSATFQDSDQPGVGAFTVTFKIRLPDDATEIVLASAAGNGAGGVTITDDGGGVYTAAVSWDPPDAQLLGLYDLYFQVSDGSAISTDGYLNNENELQVYDAISNQPVTLTGGITSVQPVSITRMGSDYTMLSATFTDPDMPGPGAFTVTFKVRDTGSVEYPIVTAAQHALQGVRIVSKGAGVYRASVLWDPPVGQVTGTYDLYFEVTDNFASTAVDDYAANPDELTITAAALAGDGYLLRRSHDSNTCGGPVSACHNVQEHQGQTCLVCHTPHGSSNIYLIRETVQTPGDGPLPVIFKTLGQGDPHNDPDPVVGDPAGGGMADDSNGVFTGICEVCHQTTDYHRNDGTEPKTGHHNNEDCRACHSHADGFPRPAGSGESDGGVACACHSAIFNPLNSSTSSYHHQLNGSGADYTIASRTCLMCHVDHNIFRGDLNTGIGARGKNLRRDITTPVVQGSAAVLLNSDYESVGSGGICLSCHVSAQTKGYVQPDGSTTTQVINKTNYDAATGTHNYSAPSTFTEDASTFNANCSKCHNDTMAKSYQVAGNQFSTHDSPYRTLVNPLGATAPADPLEEKVCLGCHSTTQNPNGGSNLDYYGVQPMSTASVKIGQTIGLGFAHPVSSANGVHTASEDGTNLGAGNRHAECVDCHNVHEASQGTHDGSSALVSNALKGVWGVRPTGGIWPAAPVPTNNGNVFVTPASYEKVSPAQYEWQICLKCHSDYVTLPGGARNLAQEINPNYVSTHGIASAGTNDFCNTTTMNPPWGASKVNYCSDCHRSNDPTGPNGPHGSNLEHLLVETAVSSTTLGTPLCLVCHKTGVYFAGRDAGSRYSKHPGVQGSHAVAKGCFACHMWEFSHTPGLGANSDPAGGTIHVHGMNKKWVYNEQDGSVSPTKHPADAFTDGYLCDINYITKQCWVQTCKVHSPQSY